MDEDDAKKRQQQASAVEMQAAGRGELSQAELDELVASSDTGARTPPGFVGKLILVVAFCWSLFQLWIASPLPFMLNFGIISATDARAVHLAFAMFPIRDEVEEVRIVREARLQRLGRPCRRVLTLQVRSQPAEARVRWPRLGEVFMASMFLF